MRTEFETQYHDMMMMGGVCRLVVCVARVCDKYSTLTQHGDFSRHHGREYHTVLLSTNLYSSDEAKDSSDYLFQCDNNFFHSPYYILIIIFSLFKYFMVMFSMYLFFIF